MKKLLLCLFATGLTLVQLPAAETANPVSLEVPAERIAEWQAMRFGMFIHWGPVSLKGTEIGWSRGRQVPAEEYDRLYLQFNPVRFDADEWARIAKTAGMKYLVITSRHHDGFSLWDTQQTDYNIMNSPFKRDVLKELAQACRRQGIKFCTYYSLCDWWHPDYPLGSPGGKTKKPNPNMDRYVDFMKKQLAELITQYGPLGILWFDGEWESPWTVERGQDMYRYLRSLQPDLIINNRVAKGRSGLEGLSPKGVFAGDYDTPEQKIGKYQDHRPWETCMTICRQWAWKPDDPMKSLEECLHTLVRCAGGDGNLLFNVGPMPDGRIEPRQVERLQEMGAWLSRYGETIYGTRGGPWMPTRNLASTRKGSTIYLHLLKLRGNHLTLPAISNKIRRATVLTGGRVKVDQVGTNLMLELSPPLPKISQHGSGLLVEEPSKPSSRDTIDIIVRLDLEGSARDIPAMPVPASAMVKVEASNVYRQQEQYAATMAFDDDPNTRWATDAGTAQAWIAADLGRTVTIQGVRITEAIEERIRKFEFQHRVNGNWETLFSGATAGAKFEKTFPPVTAREIRLNILEATNGPTISEIRVILK